MRKASADLIICFSVRKKLSVAQTMHSRELVHRESSALFALDMPRELSTRKQFRCFLHQRIQNYNSQAVMSACCHGNQWMLLWKHKCHLGRRQWQVICFKLEVMSSSLEESLRGFQTWEHQNMETFGQVSSTEAFWSPEYLRLIRQHLPDFCIFLFLFFSLKLLTFRGVLRHSEQFCDVGQIFFTCFEQKTSPPRFWLHTQCC